ncbi:MBOAT family O-acyltransferase [Hymenobacter rubripertinctus]|uniref:Acyltransferase n=1 Tax=Hymenobacter rubripertinctus TaxID=2029981 RepID=A0A418QX77_9BACT|nr:acyltransferase [Hymenobacter rubripertinctus]
MKISLKEYIKKRNGVSIGSPKSLRNNLYRSLGARNFSVFWRYWNPIFGYYLGKYIFKPLKNTFPAAFALMFTFIFCGLLHDTVTMMLRGSISLFFTIWFSLMGTAVLVTKFLNNDYSKKSWIIRALANSTIITACFLSTIYINKLLIRNFLD